MVFLPKKHLWTITGWMSVAEMNGHSFSLWASPEFLEAAKEVSVDKARFDKLILDRIKAAGWKTDFVAGLSQFGEFGLRNWSVPGNACGMDWGYDNSRPLEHGANFYSHNVDSSMQQSVLMNTWLEWAQYVEGSMWRKENPK